VKSYSLLEPDACAATNGSSEIETVVYVSCQESFLAIVIFPSKNNNNVQHVIGVLQSCENIGNS
jgi:hypothetical protein